MACLDLDLETAMILVAIASSDADSGEDTASDSGEDTASDGRYLLVGRRLRTDEVLGYFDQLDAVTTSPETPPSPKTVILYDAPLSVAMKDGHSYSKQLCRFECRRRKKYLFAAYYSESADGTFQRRVYKKDGKVLVHYFSTAHRAPRASGRRGGSLHSETAVAWCVAVRRYIAATYDLFPTIAEVIKLAEEHGGISVNYATLRRRVKIIHAVPWTDLGKDTDPNPTPLDPEPSIVQASEAYYQSQQRSSAHTN